MRYCLFIILFYSFCLSAQEDLLAELEATTEPVTFNYPAFKAMKIVNLQSTKVAEQGDLYLYVSHRFGTVKDGIETFFGLDNANTKIQLVYGLWKGLQIGLGRESLRKTYSGSAKMILATQTQTFPVNLTAYGTLNMNAQVTSSTLPELVFADRLSYASQILMARRFSNRVSFQLAPTFIRQNLVFEGSQAHNQAALGLGGRVKLSKRLSLNLDYLYNFNRASNSTFRNPLSIGLDIETGGHVFQLLFSNAQSTNEPGFMSNAEGDWSAGEIYFGFNIVRVF